MKRDDERANGEFYSALSKLQNLQDEIPSVLILVSRLQKASSADDRLAVCKRSGTEISDQRKPHFF